LTIFLCIFCRYLIPITVRNTYPGKLTNESTLGNQGTFFSNQRWVTVDALGIGIEIAIGIAYRDRDRLFRYTWDIKNRKSIPIAIPKSIFAGCALML